ncbi:hypothetical protein H5154_20385 [Pseudoalteromonas sp. SR44-5]|uniref:hypothetical protein n=1 Tax=Pseudoalteromonas sp. SR44-5 TaxID=2760934 RepID=UPI0016030DBA|nr:hypothetical protein [Pseudoalteromonas sp. SR44-5]MBB1368702.1 hypothetical protein [Pseudoalteromonas sp. SR44-5]
MWFEKLTGFSEESPLQVHKNLSVNGNILKSHINAKEYHCGLLETPSLAELRNRVNNNKALDTKNSIREIVANVQDLHTDKNNVGALFQVASQFNLLEMVSPDVTPEHGVDGYEYDRTQGPACAIAAGAGTIYRNYFANVNGEIGQTANNQIDCLSDIGAALGNKNNRLWQMKNGYALASEEGLIEINEKINSATKSELDKLKALLRIGIQWDTEVTLNDLKQTVSQVYCSALPVAYSQIPPTLWANFAKLILEACYEATICSAILNYQKTGNNKVYLTLIGGGVFGNDRQWILQAIERALKLYEYADLDIFIVSYGSCDPYVQKFIDNFSKNK